MKSRPWTTTKIVEALARRYPVGAYAFFTEVRNQTGFSISTRTADAIVMSLWPSRGLGVYGFEIKVSRSDWLKEMRSPEKAEAIQAYCDRWWLVVGSSSIVQPSELPPTWGLLVPSGTGLKVKVDAPKLDPKPLDRSFVASILREASRASSAQLEAAHAAGVKAGREIQSGFTESQLTSLKQDVATFEQASGVEIVSYQAKQIGEAVKMVAAGKHLQLERNMANLRSQAERIIKVIDEGKAPKE